MDLSSSSAGASGKIDPAQRSQIMSALKQQVELAQAQELLQQVNDKCFKMCVSKPGSSLSSSEQKCLTNCMDRYLDTWNVVSRAYANRIQREMNK